MRGAKYEAMIRGHMKTYAVKILSKIVDFALALAWASRTLGIKRHNEPVRTIPYKSIPRYGA